MYKCLEFNQECSVAKIEIETVTYTELLKIA